MVTEMRPWSCFSKIKWARGEPLTLPMLQKREGRAHVQCTDQEDIIYFTRDVRESLIWTEMRLLTSEWFFFNFINHLDRKIYQWNNWSVLNDNFSYKSQHFYPWKWPIVVVEFQEINFALCIEFHSSRNSFSEFWFLPTPLQDTREELTAIDTSQLCPVLNFVSFDNTFVWLWKFRTMKTGKKKEGKKLKKSCNAYFSTDVLLHRPAFAMVLHLQTD